MAEHNGIELAKAYVQIIPSAEGIQARMQKELEGEADSAGKSAGSKFGSAFSSAVKVAGAAIAAGTGMIAGFAKSAIGVGGEFDSSMSQIAATLGITTDDIINNVNGAGDAFEALRNTAKQMGAETNFTATEAAEGLNILAMSGYEAQQSMAMIEDVLHLSAAGAMDMSSAAGYVAGAMKGFNDESKDAGYYADLMAKGATLANTNVQQLGEALSGGAAIASSYGQSAESVTVALLRLAEQGETGANAGTALAAAMKNLYAPTDQAKALLQDLGVQAFDPATGAARDFNDVVNELQGALSGYTDEQATAYAQTIFGIQGFNAYNKMAVTSTDKQEAWAAALAASSGEAAKQYDTMTDNLTGDIDIFNSALDGLKIAVSDKLGGAAREFVQFGSGALSNITKGFEEGGISGAMAALGASLSDGLTMLLEILPEFISAGGQLISAIGQGLVDNFPLITQTAFEIVLMLAEDLTGPEGISAMTNSAAGLISSLVSQLSEFAPQLLEAAITIVVELAESLTDPANLTQMISSALTLVISLMKGLIDAIPRLLEAVPTIVQNLVQTIVQNAPQLLGAALQLIIALARGFIVSIPTLVAQIPQIIAAVVKGLVAGVKDMVSVGKDLISGLWSGISGRFASLKEDVQGLMSGFTGTVKGLFGIHSPSTVFRDEIGDMLGLGVGIGLAEGISDSVSLVHKAMGELSAETARGFSTDIDVVGTGRYTAAVASDPGLMDIVIRYLSAILKALRNVGIDLDGERISRSTSKYQNVDAMRFGTT